MTVMSDDMEWRDNAMCQYVAPDIFFPDKGGSAREAKRICSTCSVLEVCRAYALTHDVIGVWGGLSDRERAALRRGNRVAG